VRPLAAARGSFLDPQAYLKELTANHTMRVAHLADLHIRDARREEYAAVFAELCAQLAAEARRRPFAAIAIAGDVFDTMTRASAANWDDVARLLCALAEIAPVALIPGNHDLNVRRARGDTLLAPLFESAGGARQLDPARVRLWTRSGCYEHPQVPGLLWIVGTPSDALPTPGEVSDAYERCDPPPQAVVALYHETIYGCRYANGQRATADRLTPAYLESLGLVLPPALAVMLGDVHLRQEIPLSASNVTAAYPGSLVCQNLGEPHQGHGWLDWDLTQNPPTCIPREVPNPRAPYTALLRAGEDVTQEPRPERPHLWRLRADAATTADQVAAHVKRLTERHGRPPRDVIHDKPPPPPPPPAAASPPAAEGADAAPAASLRAPPAEQTAAREAAELEDAQAWLAEQRVDPAEAAAVLERHRRVLRAAAPPLAGRPVLRRLEFGDMYCYGPGNVLDFEKLRGGPPGLVGLIAPNASGKSSLLDVIYIALTGSPLRGQKLRALREGADRYELILDFELDGRPGRVSAWRKHHTQLLRFEYDGQDLTGRDAAETTALLREFFGAPAHIAQVSLYRPGTCPEFFSLPRAEQDKVISSLLALSHHAEAKKKLDAEYTKTRQAMRTLAQALETTLPEHPYPPKATQEQRVDAMLEYIDRAVAAYQRLETRGPAVQARVEALAGDEAAAAAALAQAEARLGLFRLVERHLPPPAGEATPVGDEPPPAAALSDEEVLARCQELAAQIERAREAAEAVAADGPPPEASEEAATAAAEAAARAREEAAVAAAAAAAHPPLARQLAPAEVAALKKAAEASTGAPLAALDAEIATIAPQLEGWDPAAVPPPPPGQAQLEAAAAAAAVAEHVAQAAAPYRAEAHAKALRLLAAAPAEAGATADTSEATPTAPEETLEHLLMVWDTLPAPSAEPAADYAPPAPLAELEQAASDARARARILTQAMAARPPRPSAPPAPEPPEVPVPHPPAPPPYPRPAPLPESSAALEQRRQAALRAVAAREYLTCEFASACPSCQAHRRRLEAAAQEAADPVSEAAVEAAREAERQHAAWLEYEAAAQVHSRAVEAHAVRSQWEADKRLRTLWAQHDEAEASATAAEAARDRAANWARSAARRAHLQRLRRACEAQDAARQAHEAAARTAAELAALREQAAAAARHEAQQQLAARLAELNSARKAELSRQAVVRYEAHQRAAETQAAAAAATAESEAAAAAWRRYQAYHASRPQPPDPERRARLEAELGAAWAEAAAAATIARGTHAAAVAELAAARRDAETYTLDRHKAWQGAVQHKNAAALREARAEVASLALHRRLLDPARGLTPRIVDRARATFVAAVNHRLSVAECDFRLESGAEAYELRALGPPTGRPVSRDPTLASGYQSYILELSSRAALAEIAQVPLPAVFLVDEAFGSLDAPHVSTVAEALRGLATDPPPGRPAPAVLLVTPRTDHAPVFAQRVELDHSPDRPTRLVWPPGEAPTAREQVLLLPVAPAAAADGAAADSAEPAAGADELASAAAAAPVLAKGQRHAAHIDADGKCTACMVPVSPGRDAWVKHCATPLHCAWTDPGLVGTRAASRVTCRFCAKSYTNGQRNWQTHTKSKKHQNCLQHWFA